MDLPKLTVFAAVMSTGSVTAAAHMLGKSQPAVSRLLREFEKDLGYEVFERRGPSVRPLAQAFELYEAAEPLLANARRFNHAARQIGESRRTNFDVVCTPALAISLVPSALSEVRRRFPRLTLSFRSLPAEKLVQALLSGAAQVGVSSLPLDHHGLELDWVGEAPCCAVLQDDHRLAERSVLQLDDLKGEPLILMGNLFRLRGMLNHWLNEYSSQSGHHVVQTNASANAVAAARAGLGVAVVESVSVAFLNMSGLRVVPLQPAPPFYFGVVRAQPANHPWLSDFSELVRERAASVAGFVGHCPSQFTSLVRSARLNA